MMWCLVGLFLVASTWADNSIDSRKFLSINCEDLKTQADLALDKESGCHFRQAETNAWHLDFYEIMGKWYTVEILEHKVIPERESSARMVIDRCPIIRLRRDESNLLRLLWTEEKGNVEYSFRVPNSGPHGLWHTASLQNGTLVSNKNYTQFTGSVLVMKAVAQHVVLTFCSETPGYQLWSVLMAREHILERSSIESIHNLLQRRALKISSIRSTCARGVGTSMRNINSIFIILSLSLLIIASPWY